MKDADAKAPSGVEDITFMYGGWTNHPNAVKAATWDATNITWGFNDNGTKNTTYTINNEQKIDKWEAVRAESETTDQLVTLDGYAKFTPGCGQVPTDQYGNTYDPTRGHPNTIFVASLCIKCYFHRVVSTNGPYLKIFVGI